MRVLAPTLLLLGARALAAPLPAAPVSAAVPTSAAAGPDAPTVVQAAQEPAPAVPRAPEPPGPPSAASPGAAEPVAAQAPAPAASPPAMPPVVPTPALVEKLGQGDRLFLAGDYRNALFAYQDAVYLQPRYAPSHVKLGRAYLALRYPAQAVAQAEAALVEDPESGDARKLLDEARSAPARPTAASPVPAEGAPAAPPPRSSPRVFRFTPEPDAAAPAPGPAPAPAIAAVQEGSGARPDSAPQHYRAALVHIENRDWEKAVSELSSAILIDPKLAVAYAARGSAYFGSGRYREAAEDYADALLLAPELATPVYGLAECYRALGDPSRAAEMYGLYAQSSSADVREDLRAVAAKRARELR